MRPASSRVAVLWITVLCLLAALCSLNGLASAQAAAGSKHKLSHQASAANRASTRPAQSNPQPAVTTETWTGGGGSGNTNWSDASNWNNGAITSGENILIDLTTAATVDDQGDSIGTLTLSNAGDSVTLNNNVQTTVTGNISNAGAITFNAAGNTTGLDIANSLTLSGSGIINLTSTNGNYSGNIFGTSGSVLTTSSNIVGAGTVGNGELNFINSGTINANISGQTLLVNPDTCAGCTNTNTGTLEATGGGTLNLANGTWTNTGGTISAAANSAVNLTQSVSITGGTLTTTGNGVINNVSGNDVFLTNVTNSGNYVVQNNGATEIAGTLTNTGTITLDAAGNTTELYLTGNTTLSGSGTVLLTSTNNNWTAYIQGVSGSVLTNQTTIDGWGTVGGGALQIANASSGVINSNMSGGNILVNPLTTVTSTNAGLMEATNGGTLTLSNGTWTNTGTIEAATGSSVVLNSNVSITGGTLESTGTGAVINQGGNAVFLTGLTLAGTYDIQNNAATEINGTITNNGVINLQAAGNITELYVTTAGTGSATLKGSGSIVLGTGAGNQFSGQSGTSLTIDQGVSGVGNIGAGILTLTNNSTINANISPTVSTTPLNIQPGAGGMTNTATLEATNGGTLTLLGGSFNNAGGTIQAVGSDSGSNRSTVVLTDNVTVTGGTLTTSGAGVMEVASGNTANLTNLTNSGTLNVINNGQIDATGTITNNGTITLEAAGSNTFFYAPNTTTLTGTGTLVMTSTNGNYSGIVETANGMTLTNDETITGAGSIQDGTFINNKTVNANISGQSLTLQSLQAATNTKTMEATNGGTLVFSGSSWTNTGGTIAAQTGSAVELTANTTITGGTLTSAGTGQVFVASGNTANLASLANSGTLNVQNNAQIDSTGTITNNGTITLQAAGNNTFFYAPNTTTLTGTGTLVMTSTNGNYSGIVEVGGGQVLTNDETITGAGTIEGGTFVNNGTINANIGGASLTLQSFTAANNTKTMEATNGGTLVFNGSSWTNTGGTISAQTGSAVELTANATITGGTLTTAGTGQIFVLSGNDAFLSSLTNTGTINAQNNTELELTGTITNSGTINVLGNGNTTYLLINGAVTLNGSGTIDLGGTSFTNNIYGEGTAPILISHNTIEGAGNLGSGNMGFTNDGTLDANVTGQNLAINVDSTGFTNYNGTTDTLTGGAYIANGGNITFAAGNNTGITTLSASVTEENGGQILNTSNSNANALANLTSITSTGSLTTDVNFTDAGAFSNAGSLTILSGTTFDVGSLSQISGGTLTAGTYVLDANLNITGATQSFTTNAANVTLAGGIFKNANGSNAMAALATNTGKLTLADGAKFTTVGSFSNTGTLTINAGSAFTTTSLAQITGAGADQTLSGGIFVLGGDLDVSTGTANITTNSSTLTLEGTGTIENTSNSSNALLNLATNSKSLTLAADANFTTTGNFVNHGSLAVNSGSTFTVLSGKSLTNYIAATNTLTGGTYTVGGTLAFNAGLTGAIKTDSAAITLEGTGQIENTTSGAASTNALVNLATISTTGSLTLAEDANFTAAGNFTNNNKLTIDSGSTFTLTGSNVLTNLTGGTLTGGTYTVGGTLQLTSANGGITTNAANLTLTGASAKILDGTTNALASLDNNTGSLTLSTLATLTTASSNFSNSGTVDVAKSTTLTVGGAGHDYNQTAGTTTIDGTLAGTAGAGAANITDGTILGAGTVKGNISVGNATGAAATVNVGDNGVAGLLSITGKYTQLATGNMTGLINGTTAGTGFSQLKVTGTAALAGTINFTVATAFQASLSLGETFTVLTASSVTGTFTNSTIAINATYQFDVTYTSKGVVLTVAATAAEPAVQSALASAKQAVAPRHASPVIISRVRRANAEERISRPVVVAGWAPSRGHSDLIMAAGRPELNNLRRWEKISVISPSNSRTGALAQMPRAIYETPARSLPASDLRMADPRPIAVSPRAGWMGKSGRVPVKVMSPMLPRISR